jgi:glutamine amidotransferase
MPDMRIVRMADKKVTIIDYGMGNLFSIERAIRAAGGISEISGDRDVIQNAEGLILPGVGAFGEAMRQLTDTGIDKTIVEFVKSGKPLLGICLGMQLLMNESYEFGHHTGLGLVEGKVVRFQEPTGSENKYKLPQIGWNRIELPPDFEDTRWNDTILKGIKPGSFFYFVHSYICLPDKQNDVLATTKYGKDTYCSVVCKKNVSGCQFHPERSGKEGLLIYKNFLDRI